MKTRTNLLPFLNENILEAGCDEAGRGCLAGPVFAAAVVLAPDTIIEGLNDSKKLNEKQRLLLVPEIKSKALFWAVAQVSPAEIDKINILNASILAMHRALDTFKNKPDFILVDGNKFKKWNDVPHACIVKGDGKYMSIAAASVLAKTSRDEYMENLHIQYPNYNWKVNKGYPTAEHCDALLKHGYSPHHRRSFNVKAFQTELKF